MAKMEEFRVLERILEASFDSSSPNYVKVAAEALQGSQMSFKKADQILEAKLGKLYSDQKAQIFYLHNSYVRADEWAKKDKLPPEIKSLIPELIKMIARYARLVLICPEMFLDEEGNANMAPLPGQQVLAQTFAPPNNQSGQILSQQPNERISVNFLHILVQIIHEEEGESESEVLNTLEDLLLPALNEWMQKMKGRHLMDSKLQEFSTMTNLLNRKGLIPKLVCSRSKQFMPDPVVNPYAPNKQLPRGFHLQMESFLGSVLCPTCLDTALYKEQSTRQMQFQNIMKRGRGLAQQQMAVRHNLTQSIEQAMSIINPLLRSGDECREAVLNWLSEVVVGNDPRAKAGALISGGGGPSHFVQEMGSDNPMLNNLDMRLTMQLQNARTQGFSTPGFANNIVWVLMELIKPIKTSAVATLDATLYANADASEKLLGAGFKKVEKMGDEETVTQALEKITFPATYKFPTQIWCLWIKSLHNVVIPTTKEHICFAYGSDAFRKDEKKFDQCCGEHLAIETLYRHELWLQNLTHCLNLMTLWLLKVAYPKEGALMADPKYKDRPIDAFLNITIPPPAGVSPEWTCLPSDIMDDFVDVLDYLKDMAWGWMEPNKDLHPVMQRVDPDSMLLLLVFIMGSGDHVTNPNHRGKAATQLAHLLKNPRYASRINEYKPITSNLVPSCIRVFNAVEKTKQSYYDIRYQLKYTLRVPIMELFGDLLPKEEHKVLLRKYAESEQDEFLRFMNLMMSDATMQLEEGLDTLTAIRKRTAKNTGAGSSAGGPDEDELMEGGAAGVGVDRGGIQDDERNEQGQDMYRASRRDAKEHCITYMKLGFRTIKTLHSIMKQTPEVVTKKELVLKQLIQSCLNACIDRLVGPKCLQLKGNSNDFEVYHFKPKELLSMISEMYVVLSRTDREKVMSTIISDERSYAANTFQKARKILAREQFLQKSVLDEFAKFVDELAAMGDAQAAALANVEIPDNYLDPIMDEIMADPVLLPTSDMIMDRSVIERQIMAADIDPFTRKPLKMEDLIDQPELKAEIHAFAKKNNISI